MGTRCFENKACDQSYSLPSVEASRNFFSGYALITGNRLEAKFLPFVIVMNFIFEKGLG